jgi:hypothetical protein
MTCEREGKNSGFLEEAEEENKTTEQRMGANLDRVMRKQKEELDSKIEGLDRKA